MTLLKITLPSLLLILPLGGCGQAETETGQKTPSVSSETASGGGKSSQVIKAKTSTSEFETLNWEDLMPDGEDQRLAELYAEFYEEQEARMIEQMSLSDAARGEGSVISMIEEGSALDTMKQIGTYNVVKDLDGAKVRIPGYVVPLDFNADAEYDEFLLVPYFGACLHTPPPPPNQIIFVKSSPKTKVENIYEPVWVEGVMKTGEFGSDLGNSAYELTLDNLKPYEY